MTNITQEEYRKKFMRQGSHLKYCRSVGGIGLALQTMGGMLFVIVWALGLGTRSIMIPKDNNMFLLIGSVITLLIVAGGIFLHKRKVNGYINFYSVKNHYAPEEVRILDSELSGSNVVLLGTRKKNHDIRTYYTITPHWIKYPLLTSYVRRIADIAAVWFDPEPFYKGVQADAHLFMTDISGEIMVFSMQEPFASDIIKELSERNRNLILSRYFKYGDKTYDCQEQPEQVAALYRQHAGQE